MSTIVPIKPIKFTSGEAFCLNCNHTWINIGKTGTIQLECPSCHTLKGLYKFPFHVEEGEAFRECTCENYLFIITPNGHLCPNCGDYQNYE